MKILFVNTSDNSGGAAIAASRLMVALKDSGIEVEMLVLHKDSSNPDIIKIGGKWETSFKFIWERFVIWLNNLFSKKNLFTVSIANTGFNITETSQFKEADIIHLHWINQGLLSISGIKEIFSSGKPIVWTMHDMWECTSICHHAYSCDAFKTICRNCPMLRFPHSKDLSYHVFKKKETLFRNVPINIVSVSKWLAGLAKSSALIKDKHIEVIPNTLSLDDFTIFDKQESRQTLNLPKEKFIILFGAARIDDPIKGFDILIKAIQHLISQKHFTKDELLLVTFGIIKHPDSVIPQIPIEHINMGWVTDKTILSKLYSAANVTVSTSKYETFGQTLIEAQACGCIPISFGNSGQADIITHKVNGYLAKYLSFESIADGIVWGITEGESSIKREDLRNEVLRKYSGKTVAAQYITLYKKLIKK